MPKEMEMALQQKAKKLGLKGKALDQYVYGTMRKTGWKPSREKTSKQKTPKSLGDMMKGLK